MSRHPYHILSDFTKHAKRFLGSESLLIDPAPPGADYPIFQPVCWIEEGLGSAAHGLCRLYDEYKCGVAEFAQPPFPLRIRREIDEVIAYVEERIRRWRWDYVLSPEGIDRVVERLEAHKNARYLHFLEAALSWRSGKNLAPHRAADDFADEAEKLHLKPTMSPDEGERVVWDRHREWSMNPALAETLPEVSKEEHVRLARAVDEIVGYFFQLPLPEFGARPETTSEQGSTGVRKAPRGSEDQEDQNEEGGNRATVNEMASVRLVESRYGALQQSLSMFPPSPKIEPSPFRPGGIFISYSWDDAAFVQKLYDRLTNEGVTVWHDRHDMVSGAMQKQVRSAIETAEIVVIVLSEASIQSDWVENELEMARKKERSEKRDVLCPISLDDSWQSKMEPDEPNRAMWLPLRQKLVVNFSEWTTEAFEPAYDKFLRGLKINYGKADMAAP